MTVDSFLSALELRVAKCATLRKEFNGFELDSIIHNCEACLNCGNSKVKKPVSWCPPHFLKFNIDGAARGKPVVEGIGGVFLNRKGKFYTYSQRM